MNYEDTIHYLTVLQKKDTVFQPEIREAVEQAITNTRRLQKEEAKK